MADDTVEVRALISDEPASHTPERVALTLDAVASVLITLSRAIQAPAKELNDLKLALEQLDRSAKELRAFAKRMDIQAGTDSRDG
jgi:hypothetical protein